MARVKFTAAVDQIVGKLNGSVFGKGRSGAWVRSKSRPTVRTTPRVQAVKARFAALSMLFRTLSPDAIEAWNGAVGDWLRTNIFGDTVRPSGFNLFMQLNLNVMNALGADEASILYPPAPEEMIFLTTLGLNFQNGDGAVDPVVPNILEYEFSDVAPFTILSNFRLVFEATAPISAGKTYIGRNEYRVIASLSGTIPAGTNDIAPEYNAVFGYEAAGTLPVGKNIWVRAYFVNVETGQRGTPAVFWRRIAPNV